MSVRPRFGAAAVALAVSLTVLVLLVGVADRLAAGWPDRPAPALDPRASTPSLESVRLQVKAMRQIHENVLAAKTLEGRAALLPEHTRILRDGWVMLRRMTNGGPSDAAKPPCSAPPARDCPGGAADDLVDLRDALLLLLMDHEAIEDAPGPGDIRLPPRRAEGETQLSAMFPVYI